MISNQLSLHSRLSRVQYLGVLLDKSAVEKYLVVRLNRNAMGVARHEYVLGISGDVVLRWLKQKNFPYSYIHLEFSRFSAWQRLAMGTTWPSSVTIAELGPWSMWRTNIWKLFYIIWTNKQHIDVHLNMDKISIIYKQ